MHHVGRATLLATAALSVLLSTAACASSTPVPAAGNPSPASAPSTAAPRPTSAGGGGGGTAGAGTATVPTTAGTAARPVECRTRDLRVTDQPGPAGPGLRHTENLVFRNVTDRTCSVQGYPGVSFVTGDSGRQVGSAFIRTAARTHPIELAPGERAYAPITLTQAPNACSPVTARGYRVYPPDETAAVFVAQSQLACTDRGQSVGQVGPLTTSAAR